MKTNHLVSRAASTLVPSMASPPHTYAVLFIPFSHLCSTSPFLSLPVTCNRSRLANAGNSMFLFFLFVSFLFVPPPLPSEPPSKMGESECFNYYIIHTCVHIQTILLPASRLHLVGITLHLVQFHVLFLPCHILLHSVLNSCTPSSAYSSTLYLSRTLPLPRPSPTSLPLLPSD